MIGQERLILVLDTLIAQNKFPKFCIITGLEGSGKKLLISQLYKKFSDTAFSIYGTGVDDIRQMISDCNKLLSVNHLCLIPDADNMSIQARHALLKVTEEPPKNTHIVMTLEDASNTLETIRSRAVVYKMEPYTVPQLVQYAEGKGYKNIDIIKDVCETPGEIDKLCSYDVPEFYSFANKTVDNISVANGANVFKLANKLQLKDTTEGYDVILFMKMFIRICRERFDDTNDIKYMTGIKVTSEYLKDMRIKGISKQGVIDLWILDMRKEWM